RILLNLGEVREGERVILNGLPWRIERLSFYSILKNDQLRGGIIRLPVKVLGDCISRPISEEGEMWFPCNEGDWVDLPDEGRGRIIAQTPEYVQMVKLGGAKITIPTIDFLSKAPKNLSQNFRIKSTFGIDYKHQADCTDKIPETLWAYITKGIYTIIDDRESLLSLKVEFSSAGASSLDYEIIADFGGEHAPRYEMLLRALQRLAVECSNENGWEIPFTQITLHNAYPEDKKPEVPEPAPRPKLP
ncbi:mechanosensitive ion channel family protein, partial [Verrucomicrobiales bacterium]|nr:mechanosensitive ion channel family protein [Verrucomicrobiales bacterium]